MGNGGWTRWTGLLASATLALSGCFAGDVREQEAGIEEKRALYGPGYAADAAIEAIARGREADNDLDAKLGGNASLEVVREAAVRRNPDLKAALERWVAFLERVPQKTALPFPTVRYNYSSMFKMHTVEGMQEVPFPAKLLLEGRAALAEARSMRAELKERENLLREQADAAYAALYLARREVAIVEEQIALLDRFVDIARAKYQAGTATQPDVLRAEVEREDLRAKRADLVRGLEVAASALNVLLDRRPDAGIGPLAALPAPVAPAAEVAAFEKALERRPGLAAAVERTAASDAMLSRARAEWIPDFAFGGAYVRDFGLDEDQVELTGGISLPLWFGRIRAGIAEAEAEARRSRAEVRATRNRVQGEVQSAYARTAAAAERHRIIASEALPRAEQNVKASEAAYMSGQIDFLALIDAQRMLLMERIEAERAQAEYAMRRAELTRAVGGGG